MITFDRGDDVEIAVKVVEELTRKYGVQPVCDAADRMNAYDKKTGLWRELEEHEQSQIVQGFAGCNVLTGGKPRKLRVSSGTVHGALRLARDRVKNTMFFSDAKIGMNFTNGFLVVEKDNTALIHKSPEHRARVGWSFDYDELATCPAFEKFLRDVWLTDDDEQEKVQFLQEFIGIALIGQATAFQKSVVLLGEGSNGKGTLLEIISSIFPEGLVCSSQPSQWGNDYHAAELYGKRLNIVSELPAKEISNSAAFKAIVSGDLMTARRIRESPLTFCPQAAHIFSANSLPGTQDTTYAFWRRLVILEFNQRFSGKDIDKDIGRKIRKEAPGITRWAIEGAQRALARGYFETPESSDKCVRAWQTSADHVKRFVDERCERRDHTISSDLYTAFREWWEAEGLIGDPYPRQGFSKRMGAIGLESRHTAKGNVYPVTLRAV